uniref:Uncharacterized protein n=1 Tax=Octactis speculum TaxID=3111310 RepID=A0A7S2MMB0_9STRA|mmetsp:Transcript_657/g.849  ORF Transcript_657/g.849 Transcript_657/m.849 type:complete len:411 (+) Transcript_657:214-1446(+)
MTKRIIRRFSEEKIRSDHCVFCGNNLSTVNSHETHKVTRRRIELACNETIEGLPDIYSCSVACKKNISDRRVNTEKHKKCVSKDVDKKLKSWVTDMCQSNVSTEACVHAIHDFSSGRRIEAGAAVVKKITYHPELGHALFKLQYPVDNTMITVGPSGFTSLQAQAPHKRHCSKGLEVLAKPGIWKGLSWAPRHTEYTYIDVCRELQKGDDTISLPFEAHDSSSRNCMPNSGERVLKRVSELQASFEGQSVLRHQSDKRLRQSKEEIFSLKQTNLKATEAAEKARFNLVRSHSALTSTEQKLDDTQATLKKTKRDGHRQILNARRQSEDKLLSLERNNRKANHAVERANYNAVITHVALNKSTQQLNSTQAELKKANKDAQKMIRTVACLGEAESKLDTETAKVPNVKNGK